MVAGGVPIWSVAPIWSESWMGEDGGGWGAATSSVLASTPNVTPDSPHRERVAHTLGGLPKLCQEGRNGNVSD